MLLVGLIRTARGIFVRDGVLRYRCDSSYNREPGLVHKILKFNQGVFISAVTINTNDNGLGAVSLNL